MHLFSLIVKQFCSNQFVAFFTSEANLADSLTDHDFMVASSVYKTTSEFEQHWGMSFMYIRKKVVPNIYPCDTP